MPSSPRRTHRTPRYIQLAQVSTFSGFTLSVSLSDLFTLLDDLGLIMSLGVSLSKSVFVVAAKRTPFGTFGGSLKASLTLNSTQLDPP